MQKESKGDLPTKTSLQIETRTLDLLEVLKSTLWHW